MKITIKSIFLNQYGDVVIILQYEDEQYQEVYTMENFSKSIWANSPKGVEFLSSIGLEISDIESAFT